MRGSARASAKNATLTPSQLATVTETGIETETETETVIETGIGIVLSGRRPRCVQASHTSGEATPFCILLTRVFFIIKRIFTRAIIASSPGNGPDHAQEVPSVRLVLTGPGGHAPHRRLLDETTTEKCGSETETENETAIVTETVIAIAATSATAMEVAGVVLRVLMLTLLGIETGSTATVTGTGNATNDGSVKTDTATTETAITCAHLVHLLTSAIAVDDLLLPDLDAAMIDHPWPAPGRQRLHRAAPLDRDRSPALLLPRNRTHLYQRLKTVPPT